MSVRVVVNGIGVIGKRVACAVKKQKDMKLVAISDFMPTSTLRTLLEPKGPLYKTDLYACSQEAVKNFEGKMYIKGILPELLHSGEVDVVVDCTPKGVEKLNKPMYEAAGVKAIYQGGAKADIAPVSFVAIANYEEALNVDAVRVVSCNTTSLVRTLYTTDQAFGVEEVFASLIRRATDPVKSDKKGLLNAVVPEVKIPSHQGPDVKTVLPHMNITTIAVKVPTTLAHVHVVAGKLKKSCSSEELREILRNGSRIILLKHSEGYESTAQIIERFRDLCRPRYDMYEVAVWEESVTVNGKNFYWIHAVHSEAIVIPETIDAIRAVTGIETDKFTSIEKTNRSLGIEH